MGIYAGPVKHFQGSGSSEAVEPSQNILTIPTVMSAFRVYLAYQAGARIMNGEKGAAKFVAAMAVTDADGKVGRELDKRWPELGIGCSEFGMKADPFADVASAIILGGALLRGPRITKTAKLATSITLGKELHKAAWYHSANIDYKAASTAGGLEAIDLAIPVDLTAKEATVEEMIGLFFAAATNDTDNPYLRTAFGVTALAHCGVSAKRGETARAGYDDELMGRLARLTLGDASAQKFN